MIKKIIDEYYINYKSENSILKYILFIENNLNIFIKKININDINIKKVSDVILKKFKLTDNNKINKILKINNISTNIIIKTHKKKKILNLYNKCLKKLDYYNNIKNILIENNVLNKNHVNLIKLKLNDIEKQLGIKYDEKKDIYEDKNTTILYIFL